MDLCLSHGGNVDIEIDGERLFDDIDFGVIFGAFNQECRDCYDSWVHCWFVMIGHGARLSDGQNPVDALDYYDKNYTNIIKFDFSLLKDHSKYTFGISMDPGREEK